MGDHEDVVIPEMSSPPHEVGEEDPTPIYDPSPEIPSHSGYDPSFTGHRYWLLGDETHHEPQALVIFVMACLISLHPIQHIMSSQNLSLALRLGALLFLSMRRDLGALVTLHLPSQ